MGGRVGIYPATRPLARGRRSGRSRCEARRDADRALRRIAALGGPPDPIHGDVGPRAASMPIRPPRFASGRRWPRSFGRREAGRWTRGHRRPDAPRGAPSRGASAATETSGRTSRGDRRWSLGRGSARRAWSPDARASDSTSAVWRRAGSPTARPRASTAYPAVLVDADGDLAISLAYGERGGSAIADPRSDAAPNSRSSNSPVSTPAAASDRAGDVGDERPPLDARRGRRLTTSSTRGPADRRSRTSSRRRSSRIPPAPRGGCRQDHRHPGHRPPAPRSIDRPGDPGRRSS